VTDGVPIRATLVKCVALAVLCCSLVVGAQPRTQSQRLQDAIRLLETKGDYLGAITLLQEVAKGPDRAVSAKAYLALGDVYEKLGRDGARQAYEKLIRDYEKDFPVQAAEARTRLARLAAAARRAAPTGPTVSLLASDRYSVIGPVSRDGQSMPAVEQGNVGLLNPTTGDFHVVVPKGTVGDDADPCCAAVSPDGSRLAISWTTSPGQNIQVGQIDVIGVKGAVRRTILREKGVSFDVVGWAPDNRSLVATRSPDAADTTDILLVAADTGATSLLAQLAESPYGISLSMDGQHVAYDLQAPTGQPQRDIAVLDVQTRRQRIVVDSPSDDTSPAWHPDNQRLVFVSDRTGAPGLWEVAISDSANPSEPSIVHENMGPIEAPSVSASGVLYYAQWIGGADVYASSLDRTTGRWSAPRRVARRFVRNNYFSGWSPDSRWLALTSRRGGYRVFKPGTHTLVLHDMTTHEEREFVPQVPAGLAWPSWSPDGRSVMVVSNWRQGVYGVDAGTGATTHLAEREPAVGAFVRPIWMPDGRGFVFTPRLASVALYTVETKQERVVYESPAGVGLSNALPSPDGRLVAVAEGGKLAPWSVRIVPVDGGEARAVATVPLNEVMWVAGWMPDGKTLVVIRHPEVGQASLWSVPVAGGALTPLGIQMKGLRDARLSPDGQHVSFTAGYDSRVTKVLENALLPRPAVKR